MMSDTEKVLEKSRQKLSGACPIVYGMFNSVYERVYYSRTILEKIPSLIKLAFNTTVDGEINLIKCLEKILRLERNKGKIIFLDTINYNNNIPVGKMYNYSAYLLKLASLKMKLRGEDKKQKDGCENYKKGENIDSVIRRIICFERIKNRNRPIFE